MKPIDGVRKVGYVDNGKFMFIDTEKVKEISMNKEITVVIHFEK